MRHNSEARDTARAFSHFGETLLRRNLYCIISPGNEDSVFDSTVNVGGQHDPGNKLKLRAIRPGFDDTLCGQMIHADRSQLIGRAFIQVDVCRPMERIGEVVASTCEVPATSNEYASALAAATNQFPSTLRDALAVADHMNAEAG